ncbi:MAG TPA: hypothetical protein VGE52_08440, partial [Pirellulales bacterium]
MSRPRSPRGKSSSWKRVWAKLRWWAVQLKAIGWGRPQPAPVVRHPGRSGKGPAGSTDGRRGDLPSRWSGNAWSLLFLSVSLL